MGPAASIVSLARPRERVLQRLGTAARLGRAVHLGPPLRVARDCLDYLFVRTGRPPLAATIGGAQFNGYLRHRSFLAGDARRGNSYRDLFLRMVEPGLTVVDGGAHIGVYSVLASEAVRPHGRVLAFEPDPYNFRALLHNVQAHAAGNVSISARALGAASGRAAFHLSRSTIGSSFFRRGDTARVETVEVTCLDDELHALLPGAPLLVKLNVEGAEPLVLDGMRPVLERAGRMTLFVEVHGPLLREAGTDPVSLVERLEGLGFDLAWIDVHDDSLTPVGLAEAPERGQLLCTRQL
jgi:FkbM family methyltransferase